MGRGNDQWPPRSRGRGPEEGLNVQHWLSCILRGADGWLEHRTQDFHDNLLEGSRHGLRLVPLGKKGRERDKGTKEVDSQKRKREGNEKEAQWPSV